MDISKFRSMRKKPGVLGLAVKDTTAELLIYDIVGEDWFGDGLTAKGVVQQLAELPDSVDTVLVRINSPGGDVCDGIAILNALVTFKGTVNVQIDGLCASIASVIAMAGKTISMAETASLMIHNPWTLAMGDANDFRTTADLLDKLRGGSMLPAYARSGLSPEQITAVMDAETWYTSAEAKEAGWVDSIIEMPTQKAAAKAKYDVSAFKHPPAALLETADEPTAVAEAAEAVRIAEGNAENERISAENRLKALIRAQRRAENLRLALAS